MKKYLIALLLIATFALGGVSQAKAATLDDLYNEVASLKIQVADLSNQLSAAVLRGAQSAGTVDATNTETQAGVLPSANNSSSTGVQMSGSAYATANVAGGSGSVMSQGTTNSATPTTISSAVFDHTLRFGEKSDEVKMLQSELIQKGLLSADSATGYYGKGTATAVKALQAQSGIIGGTGLIVGSQTQAALVNHSNSPAPASGSIQVGSLNQNLHHLLLCSAINPIPQVQVNAPNGGETYQDGASLLVTWVTCGIPSTENMAVTLVGYNSNNVAIASIGLTPPTPNDGQQMVTLPTIANMQQTYPTVSAGLHFKVMVTRLAGNQAADMSDNLFRITTDGPLYIIAPSSANETNGSIYGPATLDITYNLQAKYQDVYLDKDVLTNVASTTTGGQLITLSEYDNTGANGGIGNPVTLDAHITSGPTLTSLTTGVNLLPGGTYKIAAGQTAQFKMHVEFNSPSSAIAPYHRWVKIVWNGFGYANSDVNGNLVETNPQGVTWGTAAPIDLF